MSSPQKLNNVVLIVDDEPEVLRFAGVALAKAGFGVQVAQDGEEGLECFHKHHHELCLVITDIVMPKMNGLDLAHAIVATDHDIPILLVSGYSNLPLEEQGRKEFPFLRKPFLAEHLLRAVRPVIRENPNDPLPRRLHKDAN
jgi:DNA-binding NtrC family response regulator